MKLVQEKRVVNGVFKTVLVEQPDEIVGSAATIARAKRDKLLTDSDWTQGSDSPLSNEVKAEWATYRQALRDITDHANYPNLEDADWPTKP